MAPAKENLQRCLDAIKAQDHNIKGFVSVEAEDTAKVLESIKSKKDGKLYGIPVAIKDNICVEGWETTCGSNILKGYVAPYSATVINKLKEAGAILVGRTNMDEFAFGSSCETSHYGPTHNPWNTACAPGGSSGGSAAVVGAGMVPLSLGSDTGGSIRQPASFCGVVGMKPTYGRVSRYGLVAFASSLDQIGPFSTNIHDAALSLEVIAGFDPKDSTSMDIPVPEYTKTLGESIKGLKVGLPKEFMQMDMDKDMRDAMDKSIDLLTQQGAVIEEVSLPHSEYAVSVYYVIGPCEASSNLSRFDGVRFGNRDKAADNLLDMYTGTREKGFGDEAKRRILLGTFALSSGYYDAYYLKAMKARRKMIDDFHHVFQKVDVIISPTSPGGAFKIGEKIKDPLSMYMSDIFTISANITGIPALSMPCGLNSDGMPLGIQFMAKAYDEATLFKAAYAYEQVSGLKELRAPCTTSS